MFINQQLAHASCEENIFSMDAELIPALSKQFIMRDRSIFIRACKRTRIFILCSILHSLDVAPHVFFVLPCTHTLIVAICNHACIICSILPRCYLCVLFSILHTHVLLPYVATHVFFVLSCHVATHVLFDVSCTLSMFYPGMGLQPLTLLRA